MFGVTCSALVADMDQDHALAFYAGTRGWEQRKEQMGDEH